MRSKLPNCSTHNHQHLVVDTKGLVVRTVNYGESSMIATIYTRALGVRTYMLKGVRAGRGKRKGNIYQPMQFLDLVVSERANKNLQYVREAKSDFILREVPYDIKKTAIGLFILELITTTVKESEPNEDLYQFIESKYKTLDAISEQFADFHLRFMLDFSQLLGFMPYNNYTEQNNLFALQDGQFVSAQDEYPNCLSDNDSLLFHQFLSAKNPLQNKQQRQNVLHILERYYQFHIDGFRTFKTPFVFEELFG